MSNTIKTSNLIQTQLPSFIAEDVNYDKFVTFLRAYYEWMEQSGVVTSVNVVNGGLGYTNPIVTIDGDGTGATAQASINNHGSIQEIIVTSYGSGYTKANVIISGTNLVPAMATVSIQNGIQTDIKNLVDYNDVDKTTDKFLNYFVNEFLPYFPEESLVSKDKAIKVARQLYKSKGTPASYELLFRMLYDSPFEYYNTGDLVLKASAGNWFVPKSLSLLTTDTRFLSTNNLRVFGETSKSFATIDTAILAQEKIEIFISDIERLFQSGEFVRIVDNNNQDIIIDGNVLRAKVVGQIGTVTIDPNFKGLKYKSGDPVIFYGGLNETVTNPVGAAAVVGETVTGSIQHISLLTGGQGYNLTTTEEPTTQLIFTTNQDVGYTLPSASVVGVDTSNGYTITGLNTDTVGFKYGIHLNANNFFFGNGTTIKVTTGNTAQTYVIGETIYQGANPNVAFFTATVNSYDSNTGILKVSNVGPTPNTPVTLNQNLVGVNSSIALKATSEWTSNINSRIEDVLTTKSFTGYPISSVFTLSSGGGLTTVPTIVAESEYSTDDPSSFAVIGSLGILGPIRIAAGGVGYETNDTIVFTGGTGFGAHAHVSNVDSNGAITEVTFTSANNLPTGGMNYELVNLPSLSVQSANANAVDAIVYVDSIMGQGATFDLVTSQIGQIVNINVTNPGEDYIETPSISLRIQDIAIVGVTTSTIPQAFDTFYQGVSSSTATWAATTYQLTQIGPLTQDPLQTVYRLRVFNYTGDPNPSLPLVSLATGNEYQMLGTAFDSTWSNVGIINYGDGAAVAVAKFLNGLRIGQGQYLSSSGQLSSFDVIQSEDFNSFTYKITTEKEISKYRSVLLGLLHPSGTKLLGRYSKTVEDDFAFEPQAALNKANTLYFYTQAAAANVTMYADLNTPYNNVLSFNNLPVGTNIAEFIFANTSTLYVETNYGPNVISIVTSVDSTNNTVTVDDKTFLTFANTFYTEYEGNTNQIRVSSSLGRYKFSDAYGLNFTPESETSQILQIMSGTDDIPLGGLLFPGDYVYVHDNERVQVESVDYDTNIITTTTNLTSNGAIADIEIINPGSGYDLQTLTINIIGDGTGANVIPVLDANGVILSFNVVDGGHNYTTATATINGGANFHTQATLGNVSTRQITTNSSMTIVRNFVAGGSVSNKDQVRIYGPSGVQYFPQVTLENGDFLITEDGQFILLG